MIPLPHLEPVLTCYCCGTQYRRGHFSCCAAPPLMNTRAWLEKHHCATCKRCERHCRCAAQEPVTASPDWKAAAAGDDTYAADGDYV